MAAPPPPSLGIKATIRAATLSDKSFIASLSGKVFSPYGPYRTTVSQWFESGMTLTLIATVRARPAGFVMIGAMPSDCEGETCAEVLAIAVAPDFQHQGIGHELLQSAKREAEKLGEWRLCLHTARENLAAQKLFQRNGFRTVKSKARFYPSGQDALMMVSDLKKDSDNG
ncbi:MAG: GNAT family N-acetyltransferase [Deltaproteobacteria bacterium]